MSQLPDPTRITVRDTELLAGHLEDLLTEPEQVELNARLHASPVLLSALARLVELDEHLRSLIVEEKAADRGDWLLHLAELDRVSAEPELVDLSDRFAASQAKLRPRRPEIQTHQGPRVLVIPRWLAYAAAIALLAGVVVLIVRGGGEQGTHDRPLADQPAPSLAPQTTAVEEPATASDPGPSPIVPISPPALATLIQDRGGVWASGGPDAEGAFAQGRHELAAGYVMIRTERGAQVTLQSPTTIHLDSENQLGLLTGMLWAHVPVGAEGFTVQTPGADVVDLGTDFGVEVDAEGQTEVHVFTGKVVAQPQGQPATAYRTLLADSAVRILSDTGPDVGDQAGLVHDIAPRPEKFARQWSLTQTAVRTTDSIRYLYSPPSSLANGALEHDYQIFLIKESEAITLEHDVVVQIGEPGRYAQKPQINRTVIRAGTRVDSYLVHFDRAGQLVQNLRPMGGQLIFSRPILGIIVNGKTLDATDAALGLRGVEYPAGHILRGLEILNPTAGRVEDELLLTRDMMTLALRLETSAGADQMRILVQAADPNE